MNQELEAGSVTVAASVDIGAEVDVRRAFDHSETICIVPDTTISLSAYKSGEETNLLQLH